MESKEKKPLVFEFGKYTEVTDLAFEVNPQYKHDKVKRVFICTDTHTFWLARVYEGINEDYDTEEGVFLIERNNIDKDKKADMMNLKRLKEILRNDDGSNWDNHQCDSMEEVIEVLDGCLGINNLKTEVEDA